MPSSHRRHGKVKTVLSCSCRRCELRITLNWMSCFSTGKFWVSPTMRMNVIYYSLFRPSKTTTSRCIQKLLFLSCIYALRLITQWLSVWRCAHALRRPTWRMTYHVLVQAYRRHHATSRSDACRHETCLRPTDSWTFGIYAGASAAAKWPPFLHLLCRLRGETQQALNQEVLSAPALKSWPKICHQNCPDI